MTVEIKDAEHHGTIGDAVGLAQEFFQAHPNSMNGLHACGKVSASAIGASSAIIAARIPDRLERIEAQLEKLNLEKTKSASRSARQTPVRPSYNGRTA